MRVHRQRRTTRSRRQPAASTNYAALRAASSCELALRCSVHLASVPENRTTTMRTMWTIRVRWVRWVQRVQYLPHLPHLTHLTHLTHPAHLSHLLHPLHPSYPLHLTYPPRSSAVHGPLPTRPYSTAR